MAVYPDRIVLKNSTDPDGDIRSAIAVGGTDEIFYGEIVLGLGAGTARLYTRDSSDNIVAFGGSNSESAGGLDDVDLTGLEDLDILQWIASENKFRPKTLLEAGALTAVSDDSEPVLGGDLNVAGFNFSSNDPGDSISHDYVGVYNSLQVPSIGSVTIGGTTISDPAGTGLALNLPSDAGFPNYALVTDGSGNLSWASGVAADITGSSWDALSNITLSGPSPGQATWTVSNSLGASTATLQMVPVTQSYNSDQGLRMTDGQLTELRGPRSGTTSSYPYFRAQAGRLSMRALSGLEVILDQDLYYNGSSPSRRRDSQFTTFGDLDNLELSINSGLADLTIGDLSDVDLVTIPPVTGQTLVYNAAAQGGLGGWVSASLPGTGTVTSVNLNNTGGLSVSGGPVTDNGVIDVSLETIPSLVPGAYSFASITVDQYGRVTEAASGGNGAGLVTSVNGQSGDVVLSLYDLSDVRGLPSQPPTESPDVDSSWALQCLGAEPTNGAGRWKAQVVQSSPATTRFTFSVQDADSFSWASEVTDVLSAHNSGQTQYLQVTVDGFTYRPVIIETISVGPSDVELTFASSDLNVALFNGGDTESSTSNLVSKTIDIALGPENSFRFDEDAASPGQFMRWESNGFFEPHTLVLSDAADVSSTSPFNGQFLRWDQGTSRWTPSDTLLADASNVSDTIPQPGQALVWDGTAWAPASAIPYTEWTLTADGTSAYVFNGPGFPESGASNPDIYVLRGEEYRFTNLMGQHPFRIQSTPGIAGTVYSDGMTGNPVSAGTLRWVVRMDAPLKLYYQCTTHADMNGVIYVIDPSLGVTEINDLSDVDTQTSAPSVQQALVWDGANWVPGDVATDLGTSSIDELSDVDTQTTAPSDGQALVWNQSTGVWEPGAVQGITVQERAGAGGSPQNPAADISTLSFNTNNGFSVTDLGNGEALVNLGSAFAPWHVAGQDTLDPEGEEPITFVAGTGIEITTVSTSDPKQIIFSSTVSGGGGGGSGAGIYLTETQSSTGGEAAFTGLGYSGILQKATSTVDAWVVLYTSAAERTADAGRLFGDDPATGSGILAEFYITAGATVLATPGTTYFNNDTTLTEAIYAAVRTQAGAAVVSDVTISAYGLAAITTVSGGTFGSGT